MSAYFYSDTKKNRYIKDYLDKKIAKYGTIKYVYAIMNKAKNNNISLISNLPEKLIVSYLNKNTQNIDPIIINALNRITSFSWDENIKINSQWTIKSVFDPVKPYNIVSGYAFVLHDHKNNLAVLSLHIDKCSMEDTGIIIRENQCELQSLLINTHDMLLKAYCDKDTNDIKPLSIRESEILYLCTRGKSYPEISHHLHISVSTVKYHVGNVVKKLGVKNAKQAISLSSELNLASVFPKHTLD